jgi:hypothetical protein
VSTPLAAANLVPMQCMVEMREMGGNSWLLLDAEPFSVK